MNKNFQAEHGRHYSEKDFFEPGEQIFINRVSEQSGPHIHSHDFIEIAFVASGRGIHTLDGVDYNVSKGDLFVINHDVVHGFRPGSPDERLIIANCVFKPSFLDFTLVNSNDFADVARHFLFRSLLPIENNGSPDIKLLGRDLSDIGDIYDRMYREYAMKTDGYTEVLRAYLIELIIKIFRVYRYGDEKRQKVDTQRQRMIKKTIKYMEDNYAEDLKLNDLSMMAFLSRNYFCKCFKESTGMTVLECLQNIRIEQACEMLKTGDSTISAIAVEVGYRDTKYFSSVFKKITGQTPGEYRRRYLT